MYMYIKEPKKEPFVSFTRLNLQSSQGSDWMPQLDCMIAYDLLACVALWLGQQLRFTLTVAYEAAWHSQILVRFHRELYYQVRIGSHIFQDQGEKHNQSEKHKAERVGTERFPRAIHPSLIREATTPSPQTKAIYDQTIRVTPIPSLRK